MNSKQITNHKYFLHPKTKYYISILAAILSLPINLHAQELINTYWFASIELGGVSFPLNLHFEKTTEEKIQAFLQSPLQSSSFMQSSPFEWQRDSVSFMIKAQGISYIGIVSKNEDSIIGNFKQGAFQTKLIFEKKGQPFVPNRPQEPKPPYPYWEEEVSIRNKKAAITLAGTLTLPKEGAAFPAVILITGSGAQNRDEEIFMHKPFKVIADYLTKNNIAVLRLDDRGVGKSGGNMSTSTTLDFSTDIEAAFAFLKKHSRIDSKKIGLMGHSEGGNIAFIVASRNKTAFVVSLAGAGVNGKEILLKQNQAILELKKIEKPLINTRLQILKELFDTIPKVTEEEFPACAMNIVKHYTSSLSEEEKAIIGMSQKELIPLVMQLSSPWMQTFLTLEPCTYLQKIKCPILSLNGDKDIQVDSKLNLESIKKCNEKATILYMPDLNHLFQHCSTGGVEEYGIIEETFSPEALKMIKDWILSIVQ